MFMITVERERLHAALTGLNATNAQVKRAGTRAIKKTTAWVRGQGARRIAKRNDVPYKAMRRRTRNNITKDFHDGRPRGIVWFGLDEMRAIFAGAKQTGTGVQARSHAFPGAFIGAVYGPLNVFKRKGKARFPVVVQKIELEDAETILTEIAAAAPARLQTLFAQELNYAMNVEGT